MERIFTITLSIDNCLDIPNNSFNNINLELTGDVKLDMIRILEYCTKHQLSSILIIKEPINLNGLLPADILPVITSLGNDHIYCLIIDAQFKRLVPLTRQLALAENIFQINACILINPIYEYLLNYLRCTHIAESCDTIFTSLIQEICPHKLVWNPQLSISKENRINIISPFRNCESYIKETIESLLRQDYENFHIYFIDDDSSDDSYSIIPNNHPKISKTKVSKRQHSLYNVCNAIFENNLLSDSITCILDGDDILVHRYVLKIINGYYSSDDSILISYGGLTKLGGYIKYIDTSYTENEFNQLRISPWKLWALRTFRTTVFYEYLKVDPTLSYMKDKSGKFYEMSSDMALMFSLFELCNYENVIFIDSPLYGYRLHPNNDHKVNRLLQIKSEMEIRGKKTLPRIYGRA